MKNIKIALIITTLVTIFSFEVLFAGIKIEKVSGKVKVGKKIIRRGGLVLKETDKIYILARGSVTFKVNNKTLKIPGFKNKGRTISYKKITKLFKVTGIGNKSKQVVSAVGVKAKMEKLSNKEKLTVELHIEAKKNYSLGNYKKAKVSLERLVKYFPSYQKIGEVYLLLAKTSYQLEDFKGALAYADKLIKKNISTGKTDDAKLIKASVFIVLGKTDKALTILKKVEKDSARFSKLSKVFELYGEIYLLNGANELAKEYFEKVIDLYPYAENAMSVREKLDNYVED